MRSELGELYRHLSPRRQLQLWMTAGLMIAVTLAEIASVTAVIPFLEFALGLGSGDPLAGRFGAVGSPFGAIALLAAAILVAGALRLLLLWSSQDMVAGVGGDLGEAVFLRAVSLPYAEQVRHHSSITLTMVEQVHRAAHAVLLPTLQTFTSLVIATFLVATLILIQPIATLVGAASLVLLYLLLALVSARIVHNNGRTLTEAARSRTRIIQEAAGGIRDILLDRSQLATVRRFTTPDRRFRRAQMINNVCAQSPRHIVEALGILGVAVLALALSHSSNDLLGALPSVGALALGAQRLLPMLQQAYAGWSQAAGNWHALSDVLQMLRLPAELPPTPGPRSTEEFACVELDQVSYAYPGAAAPVLRNISLRIVRGERVAVVGTTGCGKSTLLDLLMGLLAPTAGTLCIDGKPLSPEYLSGWQARLAHVPQSIFLLDDSVAANLAFPGEAVDVPEDEMRKALKAAELLEFAEASDGLAVRVGERGVQLSGGQRQRLGIARALLQKPQLLILDEAMSALDEATEAAILRNLARQPELTVVGVTHRSASLLWFDRVVTLERGPANALPRRDCASARQPE